MNLSRFSRHRITMASSKFSFVETAPPIEVFAINRAYAEDTFPQKVNLGVGGNLHILELLLNFVVSFLLEMAKGLFLKLCSIQN